MSRTLNVGGNQGRGNPTTGTGPHTASRADPLALAVAAHVWQATPGLLLSSAAAVRPVLGWEASAHQRARALRAA